MGSRWPYGGEESGREEIYVEPFPGPGPKVRVSVHGGVLPRWARDMRELFYWEGIPPTRLMSVTLRTGPVFTATSPRQVLDKQVFHKNLGPTWDVAPDGKRFLVQLASDLRATAGLPVVAVTGWFDELRRLAPAKK